jgi:hypothetical protein
MSLLFLDSSFGIKVFFFLTFQSLDLERVERETPKKKKERESSWMTGIQSLMTLILMSMDLSLKE